MISRSQTDSHTFSIVIPARNESANVAGSIRSALAAGAAEVIVVDGASDDDTIDRASRAGATKIVQSLPGRGTQMNAGAIIATGRWVLFLHADNRLAIDALAQITDHPSIASDRSVWGNSHNASTRRNRFIV